jgi:hypothetical protein
LTGGAFFSKIGCMPLKANSLPPPGLCPTMTMTEDGGDQAHVAVANSVITKDKKYFMQFLSVILTVCYKFVYELLVEELYLG